MLLQPRLEKASPTLAAYAFNPGLSRQSSDEPWPETHNAEPSRPSKRSRMKTDVDGESSAEIQIKKRRLRRYLITSRLSKPYATPTTYINGRGAFRLVSCGRTTSSTRNLMMRVAFQNAARQRGPFRDAGMNRSGLANENEARREGDFQNASNHDSTDPHPPPSDVGSFIPLGLSNYDALDLEDSYMDDPWVDCEDETPISDHHSWHGQTDDAPKPSKDTDHQDIIFLDDPAFGTGIPQWEFGTPQFGS